MWSTAFIFSVLVSLATLARVYRDHNETLHRFAASRGKERRKIVEKLLWLYGVPVLALISTIISGYSSSTTRNKIKNLESQLQPRAISKRQRDRIVTLLNSASACPILVSYSTGNEEQRNYAESIVNVLTAAGFHPKLQTARMMLSIPEGVTAAVKANADQRTLTEAATVSNAFRLAGISLNWVVDSPQATNLVPVGVSLKNKRVGFPFSFEGGLQLGIGPKPTFQH